MHPVAPRGEVAAKPTERGRATSNESLFHPRHEQSLIGACASSRYHPAMSDPERTMSDTPPDRLSVNPDSPHYRAELLERGVGVKFKGVEKTNVEEYCVSEGWVRLTVGKTLDRKGDPMTVKLQGPVEPYFRSED